MQAQQNDTLIFSAPERRQLERVAFIMYLAIAVQVIVLPALGPWAAVLIAACSMMPVILHLGRQKPGLVATLVLAACASSPLYQMFAQYIVQMAVSSFL